MKQLNLYISEKLKINKDSKVKTLSRKIGRKKALDEVYKDFTPEYMKFKVMGKPKLRF